LLPSLDISSQNFDTKFGKNKAQYNKDFKYWSQYETENFIVYWYGKGKSIGHTVTQIAEINHDEIRKQLEHRSNDKLEILVYLDLSDMKQSNIGEDETFVSQSGYTKVVGNKILVYFDGNHHRLEESIREGIANIYINAMLFGSSISEMFKSEPSFRLPSWFVEGFVAYAGSNWDIYIDDELRDIVSKKNFKYKFEKLARKHPRVAGQSMWYYLKNEYGRATILDLIYHIKITHNIKKSIEFVLNTKPEILYSNWANFFQNKYKSETGRFAEMMGEEVKVKNKKYNPISILSASPSGRFLAYVSNQNGKIGLYLYDNETKSNERIFKQGFQNKFQEPFYAYPHIAWSPDESEFTYTYQDKDKIYLRKCFMDGKKPIVQLLPDVFQSIYSIDYYTSNYYIFNAEVNGMGDLYLYDAKNRTPVLISADYYNDLDAKLGVVDGKKGILFSSNRPFEHILPIDPDTLLPLQEFDIFFYELPEVLDKTTLFNLPKTLSRLTNTPDLSERFPIIQDDKLYYVHDGSGIKNIYTLDLEKNEEKGLSNLSRNIIMHSINKAYYFYTLYHDGKYKVYRADKAKLVETIPESTQYNSNLVKKGTVIKSTTIPTKQTIPIELKFQSEFEDNANDLNLSSEIEAAQTKLSKVEEKKVKNLIGMPINNVLITAAGYKFRVDKLTAKMDNEVLFDGLEIADGQNDQVAQLPMGFLMKASFKDLFENYNIEVGARIPTSLTGGEYFMTFSNNRYLLDKSFSIYQRTFNEKEFGDILPPQVSRKKTLMGIYKVKYPLNIHHSLRGTGFLRFDKQFYKSAAEFTLNKTPINEKRIGIRAEYVYDNSFEKSVNILHGTRLKVYVEGMNQFNLELFGGNSKFDLSNSVTGTVGVDARHYIPLLNHSILAIRGVSALSFGSKQNLFYLGGINNALFQSFEDNIPISQTQDFAFKSNAPNLRGFGNNIRNGTRFALGNVELRIPIMKYFLGENRGNNFFKNIQVIGFADAGLAWYGSSPYSSKNPLNTVSIDGNLIDLQIQYFRDPMVFGYGYGLRTLLFGYFIKFDVGYGVETNKVFAPKYHIGIGKDF
jgi:hypothetical protein